MTRAYYNENDSFTAHWLYQLIQRNLIAPGDIDTRDIRDVRPIDLKPYTQCHFFAGIGGWSLALRLANVADDFPVWTGSCPCQPSATNALNQVSLIQISAAGTRRGPADRRHLWPHWRWLVEHAAPSIVFGEQVESKDGRKWLAGVRSDLEELGFAVGAADLCAAREAAPHRRQRLYWVAHADGGDAGAEGLQRSGQQRQFAAHGVDLEGLGVSACESLRRCRQPWQSAVAIECEDGPRRIEPGLLALVDGVSGRMGKLRGYGNAIVPQLAATFVEASFEAIRDARQRPPPAAPCRPLFANLPLDTP